MRRMVRRQSASGTQAVGLLLKFIPIFSPNLLPSQKRAQDWGFLSQRILLKHTAGEYGQKTTAMAEEPRSPLPYQDIRMILKAWKMKKDNNSTSSAVRLYRITCNYLPIMEKLSTGFCISAFAITFRHGDDTAGYISCANQYQN